MGSFFKFLWKSSATGYSFWYPRMNPTGNRKSLDLRWTRNRATSSESAKRIASLDPSGETLSCFTVPPTLRTKYFHLVMSSVPIPQKIGKCNLLQSRTSSFFNNLNFTQVINRYRWSSFISIHKVLFLLKNRDGVKSRTTSKDDHVSFGKPAHCFYRLSWRFPSLRHPILAGSPYPKKLHPRWAMITLDKSFIPLNNSLLEQSGRCGAKQLSAVWRPTDQRNASTSVAVQSEWFIRVCIPNVDSVVSGWGRYYVPTLKSSKTCDIRTDETTQRGIVTDNYIWYATGSYICRILNTRNRRMILPTQQRGSISCRFDRPIQAPYQHTFFDSYC